MRGGKHYPPVTNTNDSLTHFPSSGRQSWAKYTQVGSGNLNQSNISKRKLLFLKLDPEESSTK
jgi:hypothetical protein